MVAHALQFTEYEHVNLIRSYAAGFFNTLVSLPRPAAPEHVDEYERGAALAHGLMRLWAGAYHPDPADKYCKTWESAALADAALERRVSRSLAQAQAATQRRIRELQHELEHHELRAHPTKQAIRSMLFRLSGEAKQLEKDVAARERSPNPCVGCPALILCRDLSLACNQFFRYTTLPGVSRAKLNDTPRAERKPTESSTMERMPPSAYWHALAFRDA